MNDIFSNEPQLTAYRDSMIVAMVSEFVAKFGSGRLVAQKPATEFDYELRYWIAANDDTLPSDVEVIGNVDRSDFYYQAQEYYNRMTTIPVEKSVLLVVINGDSANILFTLRKKPTMNSQDTPLLPYWRNETSGFLAEAITAYFDLQVVSNPSPNSLTKEQIQLIKSYLLIWVDYPGWRFDEQDYKRLAKLQQEVRDIKNYRDINRCVDLFFKLGIDPF